MEQQCGAERIGSGAHLLERGVEHSPGGVRTVGRHDGSGEIRQPQRRREAAQADECGPLVEARQHEADTMCVIGTSKLARLKLGS